MFLVEVSHIAIVALNPKIHPFAVPGLTTTVLPIVSVVFL